MEIYRGREDPSIEWKLSLRDEILAANFDEGKIQQALTKIIDNSVEAISNSGVIELSCSNVTLGEDRSDCGIVISAGNYVRVEIADSGCGMDPEVLGRVFEPFFTTKDGHRGLGLAWVYGILTNHSGKVIVESRVGKGTWVRVYLPASQRMVQDRRVVNDELRGSETILIVDDEEPLRNLEQMVLTSFGYEVLAAATGAEAVEIYGKRHAEIDLVITDLVMPTMNGRELVERLRRINPSAKIILATGYHASIQPAEAGTSLQKPFTAVSLLQAVRAVLSND